MNKRKRTKIFTFVAVVICVFAMSMVVYGDFMTKPFSYSYQYPGDRYKTPTGVRKEDNTPGFLSYTSGSAETVQVEMWGSDSTSADAANYTQRHYEDGAYRTFYVVRKGYNVLVHNGVYEKYGNRGYAKLHIISYSTGPHSGRYAIDTN